MPGVISEMCCAFCRFRSPFVSPQIPVTLAESLQRRFFRQQSLSVKANLLSPLEQEKSALLHNRMQPLLKLSFFFIYLPQAAPNNCLANETFLLVNVEHTDCKICAGDLTACSHRNKHKQRFVGGKRRCERAARHGLWWFPVWLG